MPSFRLFSLLAMATLTPSLWAAPKPLDLTADDISYGTSNTLVTASGNVSATTPQGTLQADHVEYNTNTGTVVATGNVSFTTPDSTTLHVTKLNMATNLTSGTTEEMKLSVPNLGQVMTAEEGEILSPTTFRLKNVYYSPCTGCEGERKPWSLEASSVTYDREEAKATYRNAVMEVYGVPIMYLPYFSHPLGTQQPRSGLLAPQFGHSTAYGDTATISAYMFSPKENADYTLRNRLMSKRGDLIQLERRQTTTNLDDEFKLSYLNDTSTGTTRSNLQGWAEYSLEKGRRIGVNADLASDDTYVKQYFNRTSPYLPTTVYGEDASDTHYAALSATHFQDLTPTRAPATTAQVLPHAQIEKVFDQTLGGQVMLGADMLNLTRDSGIQSRRITTNADYKKPFLMADGSKLEAGATLRLDSYNVDGSTNNGIASRALPEATLSWEKPYISPAGTHTISPRIMAALSPRGGNPDGIPNEDSVAYEIDANNLFESSRFAGLDRVETGPRLMYGLDNRWGTADNTTYRLFLGQSVRKFDSTALPASGGASKNFSDWVGTAQVSPRDWLDFSQSFRLDQAEFTPRRLDTSLRLGTEKEGRMIATYSFLDNGPENVTTDLKFPINEKWTFLAKTQNDLQAHSLLLAESGVEVKQNCYKIGFTVRRRGYTNGDIQPSTDYLVNFQLLTLGTE